MIVRVGIHFSWRHRAGDGVFITLEFLTRTTRLGRRRGLFAATLLGFPRGGHVLQPARICRLGQCYKRSRKGKRGDAALCEQRSPRLRRPLRRRRERKCTAQRRDSELHGRTFWGRFLAQITR